MIATLRSVWVWGAVAALILLWLPLLAVIRAFDSDAVHYTTGFWFRRLGRAMCWVNPSWKIELDGHHVTNPRNPYVVVSNHQSMADIPILSNLPWEMKWIGKVELFRLPIIGWMMHMANDIPVDRSDRRSGVRMLLAARTTLERKCSIIIFPEGTRTLDGRVGRFNDGAFHLAIGASVPVLPVALDGSRDCLPKKTWKFGPPLNIRVRVLPPVPTHGLTVNDAGAVRDRVRDMILHQVAEWRGVSPVDVDALLARDAPLPDPQVP